MLAALPFPLREGIMDRKPSRVPIRTIRIPPVGLDGILGVPAAAKGIVLFAHGSGSGRLSPRNAFVAQRLRDSALATLLFDLLTVDEEIDRRNVFDIALLSERLLTATAWVRQDPETAGLAIGYFGANTGARRRSSPRRPKACGSRRSCRAAAARTSPGGHWPRSAPPPS